MNGKNIIAFAIFAAVFAILLIVFTAVYEPTVSPSPEKTETAAGEKPLQLPEAPEPDFYFETEGGVFTEPLTVRIASPAGAEVYYTLNGELPGDKAGEKNCYKYDETKGVVIRSTGETSYYSFTAQYSLDGKWSDAIFNTYVVGRQADLRFTTLSAFITCEPDKLFGYESGILVAGKLRDDWIKEHPGEKPISISPAGFMLRGMESERVVNVQFFDTDGNSVINQTAGVRPYGAYTRAYKFKSIKLYARREYDYYNNKFRYDFFDGLQSLDGEGRAVLAFKRLLLRSAGSDAGKGMIRDELHQDLVIQSGFPGGQAIRPVAVYINGSYYGQMWIHDVVNEEYFEQNYGPYEGLMAVASGPEKSKPDKRYDVDDIEEQQFFYDDWNLNYSRFSKMDLTIDSNYEELNKWMDVENYLFYYAINTYVNNSDWPYNNHKAYRYYAAEGEEYREGTVFDGRWRFLPHDMDGYWDQKSDILNTYLLDPKQSRYSPLFGQLIKRPDCRDIYVRSLMELMNGAFSADNYTSTIKRMDDERREEAEFFLKNSSYAMSNPSSWRNAIQNYVNYATYRPSTLIDDLKRAFGFTGATYRVRIGEADGGHVKLGYWDIDGVFEGNFVKEVETVFKAVPEVGYEFDRWEVNGKTYDTPEITLNSENGSNGGFRISVYFKENENKRLVISEYSSAGKDDVIVLYNPYTVPLGTKGYSVSDKISKLGLYTLPSIEVAPRESVTIYCNNYLGAEKLHNMSCPFSLKSGENLYLSYGDEIVEHVEINDLHSGYKAVKNLSSGRFEEVKK